jgi:5-hydroxyisourate hydrolase-like protein (transthyretin family)
VFAAGLEVVAAGAFASCLSGFVRDEAGRPVVDGDLDFFDYDTGVKLSISGDGTDVFGFYSVCVPPGLYRVTFAPPPRTRLLGKEFTQIDLRPERGLELDVVLDPGKVVAGVVRTADGVPLEGVDVDVDRMSGGRVFTPNDKTDPASGAYAVIIPAGLYRFRFTPPRGAPWQGLQLDAVTVLDDRTLDVTVAPGALLHGRVSDASGRPWSGVELDLRRQEDGVKLMLVNKTTDAQGEYQTAVPPGTFEVRFVSPPGCRAVAAQMDSVTVGGDTRLDRILENGFLVTAVALDSVGVPLAGAELDVIRESSGQKLYMPRDKTDAEGHLELTLAPDSYSFRFDPPSNTNLDRVTLRGIAVTEDMTVTAGLPAHGWVHVTGRVVDTAGANVAGAAVQAHAVHAGEAIGARSTRTAATGAFDLALPRREIELWVAPPHGARLVARRLPPMMVEGDLALGDVVLEHGVLLTAKVTDTTNAPVHGAVLRLLTWPEGADVYAPHGETGADGVAIAALSPGRYDATVTPPRTPGFGEAASVTQTGIEVTTDTEVAFILPAPTDIGPRSAFFQSLAPNPFASAIEIGVRVRVPSTVNIDVYDVGGRRVRRLEHGDRPISTFTCEWDGRHDDATRVPSGIYFVILQAAGTTETRKILLIR